MFEKKEHWCVSPDSPKGLDTGKCPSWCSGKLYSQYFSTLFWMVTKLFTLFPFFTLDFCPIDKFPELVMCHSPTGVIFFTGGLSWNSLYPHIGIYRRTQGRCVVCILQTAMEVYPRYDKIPQSSQSYLYLQPLSSRVGHRE